MDLEKPIIRIFAYSFCAFLIWVGVDTLKNSPHTGKDLLKGIGQIVAGCVYVFVDIGILIRKKNARIANSGSAGFVLDSEGNKVGLHAEQ